MYVCCSTIAIDLLMNLAPTRTAAPQALNGFGALDRQHPLVDCFVEYAAGLALLCPGVRDRGDHGDMLARRGRSPR